MKRSAIHCAAVALTTAAFFSVIIPAARADQITLTSNGTEDGYVLESGENTNVGGTATANLTTGDALRVGDNNVNRQYVAIVSFATGNSIPDNAVITSATLKLKCGNITGTNPFNTHGNCKVAIKNGPFNGSSALEVQDFQATADYPSVASMSLVTTTGSWSTANLNANGLSAINVLAGRTQFRIYFVTDDNNDSGADYVGFYSGAATSANRPQLVITYDTYPRNNVYYRPFNLQYARSGALSADWQTWMGTSGPIGTQNAVADKLVQYFGTKKPTCIIPVLLNHDVPGDYNTLIDRLKSDLTPNLFFAVGDLDHADVSVTANWDWWTHLIDSYRPYTQCIRLETFNNVISLTRNSTGSDAKVLSFLDYIHNANSFGPGFTHVLANPVDNPQANGNPWPYIDGVQIACVNAPPPTPWQPDWNRIKAILDAHLGAVDFIHNIEIESQSHTLVSLSGSDYKTTLHDMFTLQDPVVSQQPQRPYRFMPLWGADVNIYGMTLNNPPPANCLEWSINQLQLVDP